MQKDEVLQSVIVEILNTFFELRELGKELEMVSESGGGVWGLMRIVHTEGPQTLSEIARYRGVSRQYMQKIASQLENQGYLELLDNPNDGRSKLVRLTKQGERRLDLLDKRFLKIVSSISHDFKKDELSTALDVVLRLKSHISNLAS